MKFNFKIQQYQTDAVDAVINVFNGQGFHDKTNYIRDLGNKNQTDAQMTINTPDEEFDVINDIGYKNDFFTPSRIAMLGTTTINLLQPYFLFSSNIVYIYIGFTGTCFHLNIKTASAQIFYKGRGELYVVLTLQGLNVVQKLLIRKFNKLVFISYVYIKTMFELL